MKALTELERFKTAIQTDLLEVIMISVAYNLCDKNGFSGQQTMETIKSIMELVETIVSDELSRKDLLAPLEDEYGLLFERTRSGLNVRIKE